MSKRMRIAAVAGLALGAVTALGAVVAGAGWIALDRVSGRLAAATRERYPAGLALATLAEAQATASRGGNALLMPRMSAELRRSANARLAAALARAEEARRTFAALPHGAEADRAWAALQGPWDAWRAAVEDLREASRPFDTLRQEGVDAGDPRAAAAYDGAWAAWMRTRGAYAPAEKALAEVRRAADAELVEERTAGEADVRRARQLIAAAILATACAAFAVGIALARRVARVVAQLGAEAAALRAAVAEGRLDERAATDRVHPEFRGVVEGMNAMMDAFVPPLRLGADHVHRLASGEVPPAIDAPWRGEFDAVKRSWNEVIEVVSRRDAALRALTGDALAGRLGTRAEVAGLAGANGDVLRGVNALLDAADAPVREALAVLERLAARDLRARMTARYEGDHARLARAVNATAEALAGAIGHVATSASNVSAVAAQMAAASEAVAEGATQGAAAVEETVASIREMHEATRATAGEAAQASAVAMQARVAADAGADAVARVSEATGQAMASARGTSQIIREVNEIALQTNLLALNAAVEAARAGAAGHGFAVVAEEVRALAARSKEAAARTQALIEQSVKESAQAEAGARDARDGLESVAEHVGRMNALVGALAGAAQQQAARLGRAEGALARIDDLTHRNVATAEQSSSAATELSSQAEELAALVGTFRVEPGAAVAG